ncbi:MAG: hypothetical protein KF778_02980 [Rhodocyclaceae bacterium]|nr:hypothetical protein [Rhodocyclaceae bacterium]MBX3667341.1 hypothetical protein [Rhodocyclaceae bacterium]
MHDVQPEVRSSAGWAKGRRHHGLLRVCLATAVLSACNTLDPQVMSDKLIEASAKSVGHGASDKSKGTTVEGKPGTGNNATSGSECQSGFYGELPESIAGASELRKNYLHAVKGQSTLSASISGLLIPLSAIGIYRGVTHSSEGTTRALTAMGLGASAAYLYANTLTSKPRQGVFLAGADAIGCAVVASRPYLYRCDGTEHKPKLFDTVTDLRKQSISLSKELDKFTAEHMKPQSRIIPATKGSGCEQINCPEEVRKSAPDECKKSLARAQSLCKPGTPEKTERIMPHADTTAAAQAADSAIKTANALLARGEELRGRIMMAGPMLTKKVLDIQSRVSAEVLKTEPGVETVFQSVQSLRGLAFQFSGVDKLSPKPPQADTPAGSGSAQGGTKGEEKRAQPAQLTRPDKAITDLRNLTREVTDLSAQLEDELQLAAGLSAQVSAIAQCQLNLPSLALQIEPDVESIDLPPGGKFEFFAYGGTGPVRATASGMGSAAGGSVQARADGSGGFVYTLPGAASAGDRAVISVSDGSGNLRRAITVSVRDGAQASTGAPAGTLTAKQIDGDPNLKKKFGTYESQRDLEQKIKDCNGKPELNKTPPQFVYLETLLAFEQGGCK